MNRVWDLGLLVHVALVTTYGTALHFFKSTYPTVGALAGSEIDFYKLSSTQGRIDVSSR
jgi:hypothetical protein